MNFRIRKVLALADQVVRRGCLGQFDDRLFEPAGEVGNRRRFQNVPRGNST